ncbi:MAG: alpha/beta hydrolase [Flavobacteriia bacterium]|nr:alpha/beta hydrolase [Flavobacteriia bacterium]
MPKLLIPIVTCLLFVCCKNETASLDPIPEHEDHTIQSIVLKEDRVINVWLPPSYSESVSSFPVLYMPDGGVKEDFPHIANTLNQLIEDERIPPIILVGIENTERGRDLTGASVVADDEQYCPLSDGAKDFRKFISEELFQFIDSNYRTNETRGIVGESLAGLFVMETFLMSTSTFDFYIAMDPSLWWNDHYLVQHADSLLNQMPDDDVVLWFAGSDAQDISEYTQSLNTILKRSAPDVLQWTYADYPNEHHHTIFRASKEAAFIWTLTRVAER